MGTFWKKKSGKILENKGKIMEKIRKNVGKFGKMFLKNGIYGKISENYGKCGKLWKVKKNCGK